MSCCHSLWSDSCFGILFGCVRPDPALQPLDLALRLTMPRTEQRDAEVGVMFSEMNVCWLRYCPWVPIGAEFETLPRTDHRQVDLHGRCRSFFVCVLLSALCCCPACTVADWRCRGRGFGAAFETRQPTEHRHADLHGRSAPLADVARERAEARSRQDDVCGLGRGVRLQSRGSELEVGFG